MAKEKKRVIRINNIQDWRPYKGKVLIDPVSKEGATTEAGILIGFNVDTNYGEGKESHVADFTPTEGTIIALPLIHSCGDDYYMPCEVKEGDHVWFSYRGAVLGTDVIAGDKKYLLVDYQWLIAARREEEIKILNGFVLLEEIEEETGPTLLKLPKKKDQMRGIVRYLGGKRNYYNSDKTDDIDIEAGDVVLLRKGMYNVPLERQPYLATFDGGKPYRRVKRGDIVAVLSSFETITP